MSHFNLEIPPHRSIRKEGPLKKGNRVPTSNGSGNVTKSNYQAAFQSEHSDDCLRELEIVNMSSKNNNKKHLEEGPVDTNIQILLWRIFVGVE